MNDILPTIFNPKTFCLAAAGSLAICLSPLQAQSPSASPAQSPAPASAKPTPSPTPDDRNEADPVAAPVPVPPVPAKFKHPGLLINLEELQIVKKRIEEGKDPWKSAFETMKASKWATLKYKARPFETVSSGFLGAGGAAGGAFNESDDAIAAYTQALMWIFTGNETYAQNAVKILNAWTILQKHEGPNWYMMTEWEGAMWPQSAELIRATYPKCDKADIAKFSDLLNRVYLPVLHNRMSYGNREFGVINALMAIGVFNNDRGAFLEGMSHWVSYVPNWIYLKEDGVPKKPNYWLTSPSNEVLAKLNADLFPDPSKAWFSVEVKNLGDDRGSFVNVPSTSQTVDGEPNYKRKQAWNNAPQEAFIDGLCAETFRDLGHCDLGFYELIQAAEIAWHQGIDLYSIHAKRITAFMELQSFLRIGDPIPKAFYRVTPAGLCATYEIAYNHYHNRMGMDLPKTKLLLETAIRPCVKKEPIVSTGWSYVLPDIGIRATQIGYPAQLANAWEILTHAELGGAKTPQ
jgi:hypothetical protein